MIIHLGYSCICTSMDNITTSSTLPLKNYSKELLDIKIRNNLDNLIKILDFNNKNNIHFYRISSRLIPLSTYYEFDYINKYKKYYDKIKELIVKQRVDFHLDHFTVLNSINKDVVINSIRNIEYHYKLLEAMGIKDKVMIIHVGSNKYGKDKSIERFINNYNLLPEIYKSALVIENDDKIFNIDDCLKIKEKTGIRIVLDYHHHLCNPVDKLDYKKIFEGWDIPKLHYSSAKNLRNIRSHHDYINVFNFMKFLDTLNSDVDIMLECKEKDNALFKLIRQLKYYSNYTFIDDTTIKKDS